MIFQRWNSLVNAWQLTDSPIAGDQVVTDELVSYIATYLTEAKYGDVRYHTVGEFYRAVAAFVDGKVVVQIDITRPAK